LTKILILGAYGQIARMADLMVKQAMTPGLDIRRSLGSHRA
jgi:hypothetical protein